MEIIEKYASDFLSIKQRAENNLQLPDCLYINDIAILWFPDNETMRLAVERSMTRAYSAGDLIGVKQKRPPATYSKDPLFPNYCIDIDVSIRFKEIFNGIEPDILIRVADFVSWISRNNYKIPTSKKCLLNKWAQQATQNKKQDNPLPEIRRKRKPMQRTASDSLQLIDNLLTRYNVEYLDELSGKEAWRLIVSGEFKDPEIITTVSDTKTSIKLNDGKPILKRDFLEQYRKRFEVKSVIKKRR